MADVTVRELQLALLDVLKDTDILCREYNLCYSLGAGTLLGAVRHKGFIPWDDDIDIFMPRDSFDRLMQLDDEVFSQRGYTLQRPFTRAWPSGYGKICKNNTTYIENYRSKNKDQHHGIFVDIFPIDNLSDQPAVQKLQWAAYRVFTAKALANRGYSTKSPWKKVAMALVKGLPTTALQEIVIARNQQTSKMVHCFFGVAYVFEESIFPREIFEHYQKLEFEGFEFPVVENYNEALTILYGDYMKLPPEEERIAALHAVAVDLTRAWSDEEIEKVMPR